MRKTYIDYLRVIGVIAVVTIYITAKIYNEALIGSPSWWVANVFDSFSRFSVPLFVVISGAVLSNSRLSIGQFYGKRIIRLIPPLLFWSIFYVVLTFLSENGRNDILWSLKIGLFADGQAYFHLWYLTMFLCLMVFAPFIIYFENGVKPTQKELVYFIFVCGVFFNFVSSIASNIFEIDISWFKSFHWYIVYFVAGHYIEKYGSAFDIGKSTLLLVILLLTASSILFNYFVANSYGIIKDYFILDNTGPAVLVIPLSVFCMGKKMASSLPENRFIKAIADSSFGIYLIHPFFILVISKPMYHFIHSPIVAVLSQLMLTTILSFLLIHFLRKNQLFRTVC